MINGPKPTEYDETQRSIRSDHVSLQEHGDTPETRVVELDRVEPGADGSVRKAHYGDGKQPWDTIKELGWGPEFAAANVLKYLRRTKDVEGSRQKALWYKARLVEMMSDMSTTLGERQHASFCTSVMIKKLTSEEWELLL
jgi:hypothetical protein